MRSRYCTVEAFRHGRAASQQQMSCLCTCLQSIHILPRYHVNLSSYTAYSLKAVTMEFGHSGVARVDRPTASVSTKSGRNHRNLYISTIN